MMNSNVKKTLIKNIRLLCVAVFVVANSSLASNAQDNEIFHECDFEKNISESFLNWKGYPKFACEKYKENCDQVNEKEKVSWPKYESTEQIENICKAKVQSHIDEGMEFETIVAILERANLNCVDQPESWLKRRNKKRMVRCLFSTSYQMPKAVSSVNGFPPDDYVSVSISFSTTIMEELSGELNVFTNFSSMFP